MKCPSCKSFIKPGKLRACGPFDVGWHCKRCNGHWIFKDEADYQGTHTLNSLLIKKRKEEEKRGKRIFNPTER